MGISRYLSRNFSIENHPVKRTLRHEISNMVEIFLSDAGIDLPQAFDAHMLRFQLFAQAGMLMVNLPTVTAVPLRLE